MRILFARGKSNERSLSGQSFAGSAILRVEDASSAFSPGDCVFVSDADGSGVECLGPAAHVASSQIHCVRSLTRDRAAGARCWKPENALVWSVERNLPHSRRFKTGVSIRESAGGVVYLTKLREAEKTEILRFEKLRRAELGEFEDWLVDVIEGGAASFSFADENGAVSVVALFSPELEPIARTPDSIDLELTLRIIGEAAYV